MNKPDVGLINTGIEGKLSEHRRKKVGILLQSHEHVLSMEIRILFVILFLFLMLLLLFFLKGI
jgi:hypothetical protein